VNVIAAVAVTGFATVPEAAADGLKLIAAVDVNGPDTVPVEAIAGLNEREAEPT
jgi:hypothetical protein